MPPLTPTSSSTRMRETGRALRPWQRAGLVVNGHAVLGRRGVLPGRILTTAGAPYTGQGFPQATAAMRNMVTNLPAALLILPEALVPARASWQIELLFKLWRSHGRRTSRAATSRGAYCAGCMPDYWRCWCDIGSSSSSSVDVLGAKFGETAQTVRKYALHPASSFAAAILRQ